MAEDTQKTSGIPQAGGLQIPSPSTPPPPPSPKPINPPAPSFTPTEPTRQPAPGLLKPIVQTPAKPLTPPLPSQSPVSQVKPLTPPSNLPFGPDTPRTISFSVN